jgi:hypothetical protein
MGRPDPDMGGIVVGYESRGWQAIEATDLVGSSHWLTVSGEVEVRRSNETPKLTKTEPQGSNPSILLLTLSVDVPDQPGGDIMEWKSVVFHREISAKAYKEVTVGGETKEHTFAVKEIVS